MTAFWRGAGQGYGLAWMVGGPVAVLVLAWLGIWWPVPLYLFGAWLGRRTFVLYRDMKPDTGRP